MSIRLGLVSIFISIAYGVVSACGTMSDAGLYRAPLNIPVPPVVAVRAVPRSGNGVEARSKDNHRAGESNANR